MAMEPAMETAMARHPAMETDPATAMAMGSSRRMMPSS
jgi:hypothetical protein